MFFFFEILFCIIRTIYTNSIIFQYKTVLRKGLISQNDINYNISHFTKEHYSMPAYISIKIGSPPQEIKFLLTNEDCGFKIGKAKKCINDSQYLSHYNRNLSQDFKYTNNYTEQNSEFRKGHSCSDNMEFNFDISDLNKKNIYKDIGFYLGTDTNEEICGIIGLELNNYKLYCDTMNNIFESLKYNRLIEKQNWIIKYTSKYEGLFIISVDLKNIIKNYEQNKFFVVNTYKKYAGNSWQLIIDKVTSEGHNETINKKIARAEINNDMDLIEGDWDYYYYITRTFFNIYIKKSICNLEETKIGFYTFFGIECNKEKFKDEDMKKFPVLTLTILSLNSEFKLDYKDLFTETRYKIFFNIIFNKFISEKWAFGKPILRKYPMIINYEEQTIGYYNENWEIEEKDKDKEKNNNEENKGGKFYFYLIILLVLIMFIIIGVIFYFVGKNKNKMKKRRANELLDDNYDYIPNKKNKDENNKNDNIENNNIINV